MRAKRAARKKGLYMTIRVVIYAAIAIAVLLVLATYVIYREQLTGDQMSVFINRLKPSLSSDNGFESILIDEDKRDTYAVFQNSLLVCSNSGVRLMGAEGRALFSTEYSYSDPVLAVSKNTFAVADRGGTSLILVKKNAVLLDLQTDRPIYDISMNERGYLAVVTGASGHKGIVRVYDPSGVGIYEYYSKELYLTAAAVSPNGKRLAVAGAGIGDGWVTGQIVFIDMSSEDTSVRSELSDTIVQSLAYKDNDRIAVLCQNRLLIYNEKGESISVYDFGGKLTAGYNMDIYDRVLIMLVRSRASTRQELVSINLKGEERGILMLEDSSALSSAAGKHFSLLSDGVLRVYNSDLTEQGVTDGLSDVRHILQKSDGSVVLIYDDMAKLLS